QDPRILKTSPTGDYTTYAFEWGWLDLWLKLGVIGLLVYLGLIWEIFKVGFSTISYKLQATSYMSFGLLMTLVALVVIHNFTPYLNHPLGLGWLIFTGLFLERNRF
ncbi:MAG: hypothetical protein AAB673_00295, partial [Patescibacteria group bacterium]